MNEVLTQIGRIGMLPVLSIDKKERALPLAQALSEGGLPAMEVMFRTEAAADSIELIAKNMPDFIVGAGTVLTLEQAQCAVKCGAKFLVAPGFNPEIVEYALKQGIPMVPGCISPSEVDAARRLGVTVLKFFPAVQNGGVAAMGLLSGPFPDLRFVPTGDLTLPLAVEYLSFKKTAAAGGDFMLSYDDIHSGNYQKIKADCAHALAVYFNFHIAHLGMNAQSKEQAGEIAAALGSVLELDTQEYEKSTFAGPLFEVMHQPYYHAKGHIAIGTRDAERAYYWMKRKGIEFFEDSVSRGADGRVIAAYLKQDFNGFALHLLQD